MRKKGIGKVIHPDTELRFINDEIGFGVFAKKFIPKGTIVWAKDDLDHTLDESWVNSLEPIRRKQVLKYSYRDRKGNYILCWDIGRFVNHSFHSSCIDTAYDFELAARDIHPGEELTDDYGFLNLDEPFNCLPEEGSTRQRVMPDDFLNYYKEWDQKAMEAIKYINKVEQPLLHLLNSEVIRKVNAIAEGREQLDSILCNYYDRRKDNSPLTKKEI